MANENNQSAILARRITRSGSIQTYYTAKLVVDKDLVDDFFRAYAYFRWIDDMIDVKAETDEERLKFIANQRQLIEDLYVKKPVNGLLPEEIILRDLIDNDRWENSGLKSFICNMFAIIEFDAHRKGRLINGEQLDWYVNTLGKSVTDGLLYFIGNGSDYPDDRNRYLAGEAAHITHLLRDTGQDNLDGFFNIPSEYLSENQIRADDIDNPVYKEWVRRRVATARSLFREGKKYLDDLDILRSKIAGYWYCARFEVVLDTIEADGYRLREEYHERRQIRTWLKIFWLGIALSVRHGYAQLKAGTN
jgi:phytoene/squalene synthetase